MADYTISAWLKGMVADFDISDQTLKAVVYNNGLTESVPMYEIDEKSRDLCLADLYMAISTSSSKSGSIYDSDGGWQKGRATKNVVDRRWFKDQANALYRKWAPEKVSDSGTITLKSLY